MPKNTQNDTQESKTTFSWKNWKHQKHLDQPRTTQQNKIEKKNRIYSNFKNVSGKSHNAETPKKSSMLPKPLVSRKNRGGGFDEKLESRIVPKNAGLKKHSDLAQYF